jgi:hypothetical protein
MPISWYLNNSDNPNMACNEDYDILSEARDRNDVFKIAHDLRNSSAILDFRAKLDEILTTNPNKLFELHSNISKVCSDLFNQLGLKRSKDRNFSFGLKVISVYKIIFKHYSQKTSSRFIISSMI